MTVRTLKKSLISISLLFFISACNSLQKDTSTTTGSGTTTDTTGTTTTTDTDDTLTTTGPVDPEEESSIVPGSPDDFIINVGDRIFFSYESFDLDADAQETLQLQAAWLKQHQEVTVTIEGHCDERGTVEYNLALGERRAGAVKSYLGDAGLEESRIEIISYGEEKPADMGHDEQAWSKNRRADLKRTEL